MKKSLLITIDFPPSVGGVATYYQNICKNLPADKIVVLAPKQRGSEAFDNQQKYKIIRKNLISSNPLIWPKWWPMIGIVKNIIKKEGIKNILVGQILPVGTVALYIRQINKIPYYVFCHGLDINHLEGRKKILAKKIFQNSSGAFANSQFTKDKEVQLGAKHIQIVHPCPNIINTPDPKKIERIKMKYDLYDKKILLTVGRLVKRKGHDKVIEILPEVLKKFPDLVYIIAGGGAEKENLEMLARSKRVADNVIFTGQINDEEIAVLFEICDIFIMVSRQMPSGDVEGFGIVYLEANAFSKPVIAGDTGGVSEAVQNDFNGLLINPNGPGKIVEAIIKLLKNESLAAQLGAQGQTMVLEKFNWENQAGKVEEVLSFYSK